MQRLMRSLILRSDSMKLNRAQTRTCPVQMKTFETLSPLLIVILAKAETVVERASSHSRTQSNKLLGANMKDEFFSAITQGDFVKVKALLEADGTLAQAKDQNGLSAIMKATYYRKKDVVA